MRWEVYADGAVIERTKTFYTAAEFARFIRASCPNSTIEIRDTNPQGEPGHVVPVLWTWSEVEGYFCPEWWAAVGEETFQRALP